MSEELGFKIKVDSGEGEKSVKSFKQELKEARDNVVEMSRNFGELSPQAVKAAQSFSKLREELNDVNELTAAVTEEKRFTAFANFGASIAGGFSAAQGAITLVTGSSKDLEKALVKIQSAMALSQGLAQVADIGRQFNVAKAALSSFTIVQKINSAATETAAVVQKLFAGAVDTTSMSFKLLKGAIIATGIGALVVALGYVISNFDKIKTALINLFPALSKVSEFIGTIVDKITDFVGVTSDATRETDKLREAIENQNAAQDKNIQLLEASGATAKEVRAAKTKMYEDEIQNLTKVAALSKSWNAEDLKRARELQFQKQLLNVEQAKDDRDAAAAAAKKADEDHKQAVEKAKQRSKELLAIQAKEAEERKKLQNDIAEALETSREKQVDALQKQHDFEIKLLQAQGKDATAIRAQQINDEIALIEQLGGKQIEKIQALEQEKVIAAATAKKAAEDKLKEAEDKQKEQIKGVQDQLNAAAEDAKKEGLQKDLDAINDKYGKMVQLVGGNEQMITEISKAAARERSEASKKWDDITVAAKLDFVASIGNSLNQLSTLFAKHTAAAKAIAITGIIVEQAAAIGKIVMNTQAANAKAVAASPLTAGMPWVAINTAQGIISGAASVAAAAKAIAAMNSSGAGSSAPSMPATTAAANSGSPAVNSAPTMDGIQSTLVQQTKELTEGKDALKAYVVESEITQKQERNRAITQTANF